MIHITKLIHSEKSVPVFSFLIGMGLMVLFFHKPYAKYQSLTIPVSKIEGKTVRVGEKCYSYTAKDSLCPLVNKDGRRSD